MKRTGLLAALMVALAIPAAAQGITASGFENTLSPITELIKGTVNIGWGLTQLLVGMDETSVAYFTYQLGFRGNDVAIQNILETSDDKANCSIGSFAVDGTTVTCSEIDDEGEVVGTITLASSGTTALDLEDDVADYNGDGNAAQLDDLFEFLIDSQGASVAVNDSAKGQVMLFALILPLGMMWFILMDFLYSTGILRRATSMVVALGIALIAARSGVYTGLLSMISSIFGAGGFFLSMLSIYLILAVLLWFYGGIRRSKKIAESEDIVASAVVSGFARDLERGMMQKQAAKELAKKKD